MNLENSLYRITACLAPNLAAVISASISLRLTAAKSGFSGKALNYG